MPPTPANETKTDGQQHIRDANARERKKAQETIFESEGGRADTARSTRTPTARARVNNKSKGMLLLFTKEIYQALWSNWQAARPGALSIFAR